MANLALANEHKRALRDISTLAGRDMRGLLRLSNDLGDAEWASAIRETAPKIIKSYGSVAAQLSAAYYNRQRSEALGAARGARAFSASTSLIRGVDLTAPVTKEMGFYLGQAIAGDFSRSQIVTPALQLVEKGVFDHSRELVARATESDRSAESLERVVSVSGCEFCQYMAVLTYSGADGDYHKGCGCVVAPIFSGEQRTPQPWEDEFNKDYEAAKEQIRENGESMTTSNITSAIRGIRAGGSEE